MAEWVKHTIVDKVDEFVHSELGGVCQNASERVGDVALQYRSKEIALGPTHYICSTALAVCHVQNVVIHRFKQQLAKDEMTDTRIEVRAPRAQRHATPVCKGNSHSRRIDRRSSARWRLSCTSSSACDTRRARGAAGLQR